MLLDLLPLQQSSSVTSRLRRFRLTDRGTRTPPPRPALTGTATGITLSTGHAHGTAGRCGRASGLTASSGYAYGLQAHPRQRHDEELLLLSLI